MCIKRRDNTRECLRDMLSIYFGVVGFCFYHNIQLNRRLQAPLYPNLVVGLLFVSRFCCKESLCSNTNRLNPTTLIYPKYMQAVNVDPDKTTDFLNGAQSSFQASPCYLLALVNESTVVLHEQCFIA